MTKQASSEESTPKPISARKLQANRLNTQKSIGPRTQEGKNRSRWNAMKHGLLSRHAVITEYEDQKRFEYVFSTMHSEFKPSSVIEEILVERIVDCYWNLGRIARSKQAFMKDRFNNWQDGPYSIEFDINPISYITERNTPEKSVGAFIAGDKRLHLLHRYETTIENKLYKALHELERLQRMKGGQLVDAPVVVDLQQS